MALKIRKIEDESQYRSYMQKIDEILGIESHKRTEDQKEIVDLLSYFVELFEKERFPIKHPTCIESIKFRMEQQNLSQKDLIPYIGSQSKVSEVLSGKRSLSKEMIRSLNKGLAIPLDSLLNEATEKNLSDNFQDPKKYPITKMRNFGWIDYSTQEIKNNPSRLLDEFFAHMKDSLIKTTVFAHASINQRVGASVNRHSLFAWIAQVCKKATRQREDTSIKATSTTKLDDDFLKKVVRLSVEDDGPIKARNFLAKNGISLVVERHLPQTRLDGAALRYKDMSIVAMTLRYDRIDNFWFTLLHELSHVQKHFDENNYSFVDDLDIQSYELDPREAEADKCAYEAILPYETWQTSKAFNSRSEQEIKSLAREYNIHHALLFGRLQRELDDYRTFRHLIGQGTVRNLFNDVRWD